jgi:hypothetical protein
MLETLIAPLLIAQADYFYLTTLNKVAVERRITDRSGKSDFYIAPRTISGILGFEPQCSKSNPQQIRCIWSEGERQIQAFWSEPWKFQRWESKGF